MADLAPTRRGLLGLFAVAAPAIALAAPAAAQLTQTDRFLLAMETIHPEGRKAAERAVAAGMRPKDLFSVVALREGKPGQWPALLFQMDDKSFRTFRPWGEDRDVSFGRPS